jgi:hypothetical protein
MQKNVTTLAKARQKMKILRANPTRQWSITKLCEKEQSEQQKKVVNKVFISPDQGLDMASVQKRENDLRIELEKRKLEYFNYELDIQGLREEICLFGIHKDQVLTY